MTEGTTKKIRTFPSDIEPQNVYEVVYINDIHFDDAVFIQRKFLFFKWIEKRIRINANITFISDCGCKCVETFIYDMKESDYEKLKCKIIKRC